jgi:hypothetical protein
VLTIYKQVYRNDAAAKDEKMSPEERLIFHQENSKPMMDKLFGWLNEQIDQKRVEPNSSLGKSILYMQNHWDELTLFLREPGAPIDNNIVERSLRMVIIHRNNSLFFKTENGAYVGDIYLSLIQTCNLCNANPIDYLTQLQKHPHEVRQNPSEWMPWNYTEKISASSQN